MRNRVTTAFRHLFHLLKNQVVAIACKRDLRRNSNKRRDNEYIELVHRRISKHRNMISQRQARDNKQCVRVVAGRVLNELHAALHKNEWRWERFYPV